MKKNFQDTNIAGYKKDKTTGIVINTSVSDLVAFKKHRQTILERNKLQKDVQDLKEEMTQVQKLMLQILERLT